MPRRKSKYLEASSAYCRTIAGFLEKGTDLTKLKFTDLLGLSNAIEEELRNNVPSYQRASAGKDWIYLREEEPAHVQKLLADATKAAELKAAQRSVNSNAHPSGNGYYSIVTSSNANPRPVALQ